MTTIHASDCAIHNAPAYPPGECDCGAIITPVIPLFGGEDPRLSELDDAILAVILERGKGLPFAAVVGVLRLVEDRLIRTQRGH
jgi:hypothetical protein